MLKFRDTLDLTSFLFSLLLLEFFCCRHFQLMSFVATLVNEYIAVHLCLPTKRPVPEEAEAATKEACASIESSTKSRRPRKNSLVIKFQRYG